MGKKINTVSCDYSFFKGDFLTEIACTRHGIAVFIMTGTGLVAVHSILATLTG